MRDLGVLRVKTFPNPVTDVLRVEMPLRQRWSSVTPLGETCGAPHGLLELKSWMWHLGAQGFT